jgi:hypothetical protein
VVGELELTYEAFELPADPGLQLSTYTAEPTSPSEDKLRLLASWSAAEPVTPPGRATVVGTPAEREDGQG